MITGPERQKSMRKFRCVLKFYFYQESNRIYIANSKGLGYLQGDSLFLLYPSKAVPSNLNSPYAMTLFAPDQMGVASCDGVIL